MTAAAFRLKPPPEPLEADLHASCVHHLEKLLLPPAFFFSAAIGATKLLPQQAAALSRAGVRRGLPDLFVLNDGRLYGIELKRQRNAYLSKTRVVYTRRGSPRVLEGQVDVFPKLEAAGMQIAIVHSVDEMLAQLARWQIPMRRWT
jgi:hypothetical protein